MILNKNNIFPESHQSEYFKSIQSLYLTRIKHPAASSEVLKALFRLLVFNQPSPQGARN